MGPKRVQASLSSFFTTKSQKSTKAVTPVVDSHQPQTKLGAVKASPGRGSRRASTNGRKRRRTVDSEDDDDDEGDDGQDGSACPSDPGASDSDYASSDESPPKLHKGADGQAQSKGRTLVKSVSDTTNLMQRLRMRAKQSGSSDTPSAPALSSLMTPGTLESTAVQLVVRQPGVKYTPLEIQVLDAKRTHPDMLLAVEVGYKFRFFGEDARIASRVLGIMCTVANNFYNASIPTPRLMIHVRRLVHAGYKVGVLRQVETAALKAVSDNKSAPFTRQLAEVYTAGTMIEEVGGASADAGPPNERYLVCVVERVVDAKDKRISLGMLAVQVTTGSVLYDQFEDSYLRGALETRLVHLQPGEILIPPGLSAETLRTLSAYVGYKVDYTERPEPLLEHANRAGVRVAFANPDLLDYSAARCRCTEFYADNSADGLLSRVFDLPESVVVALALLIDYLRTFNLDRALITPQHATGKQPFVPFHTRLHMLLSATALQTLSVFTVESASSSDDAAVQLKELLRPGGRSGGIHSAHMRGGDGSLFSVMDFTRSQFGRRLLRRWIAHPLVSPDKLRDRIDAVEYLKGIVEATENDGLEAEDDCRRTLASIHGKIGQLVDLERGLCRIHYGQASPQELLRILRSLETAVTLVPETFELSEPRLLAEVLSLDTWSSSLREAIAAWRGQIDYSSARSGRKENMFTHGPQFDKVQTYHARIAAIEHELQEHAGLIRQELKDGSFEFKSISGIDYLIDIKNTKAKSVPLNWVKISGTKSNSRFHTPFISEKLAERERCRESLQQAARSAYTEFLRQISGKYAALRQLVGALATLDALFSLAVLARQSGYCRPELSDSAEASVDLVDAVNPILSVCATGFVANNVQLGSDAARAMILTGPNAGGKSTLIRTVALISIMAQCGSYVPAASARLSIIDAIVTRMGASDNLMAGESTFMVEMRETAELLRGVTPRSLAIIDELGRGTSTHDGAAIAFAVLDYLVQKRPLAFFVTHYAHLVDAFAANTLIRSCHMAFLEQADTSSGEIADITFLYKLVAGASVDSFGLNVARLAGLPESLLRSARARAKWMRDELDSKWAAKCARQLQCAVAQARLRK